MTTRFPQQWSWLYDLPGRGLILSRREHAARLPLEPSHHVLEVGAGAGRYSAAVAARVPLGHLELFDKQPGMLEKAQRRMSDAGLSNVGFTLGDANNLPFRDQRFDLVFLVTVFGELTDKHAFLRHAKRVLKQGGVLSISEHRPDPDYEASETVRAQVEPHGFLTLQQLGASWSYTLNFKRL